MFDRRVSLALLILLFYISVSESQKQKGNERRLAGLVPYPRIGRTPNPKPSRSDHSIGLVFYPRVGRSGMPSSNLNDNHYHDLESDGELEPSNSINLEQIGPYGVYEDGDVEAPLLNHVHKTFKNRMWFTPEHVREARTFYHVKKYDNNRLFGPGNRASRMVDQSTIYGYTPRFIRETDFEGGINYP